MGESLPVPHRLGRCGTMPGAHLPACDQPETENDVDPTSAFGCTECDPGRPDLDGRLWCPGAAGLLQEREWRVQQHHHVAAGERLDRRVSHPGLGAVSGAADRPAQQSVRRLHAIHAEHSVRGRGGRDLRTEGGDRGLCQPTAHRPGRCPARQQRDHGHQQCRHRQHQHHAGDRLDQDAEFAGFLGCWRAACRRDDHCLCRRRHQHGPDPVRADARGPAARDRS